MQWWASLSLSLSEQAKNSKSRFGITHMSRVFWKTHFAIRRLPAEVNGLSITNMHEGVTDNGPVNQERNVFLQMQLRVCVGREKKLFEKGINTKDRVLMNASPPVDMDGLQIWCNRKTDADKKAPVMGGCCGLTEHMLGSFLGCRGDADQDRSSPIAQPWQEKITTWALHYWNNTRDIHVWKDVFPITSI